MTIKDILNDISPRIKSKKDFKTKRFKRRKQKDFHHTSNISSITKRIKGALCDDINDDQSTDWEQTIQA